MLYGFALLTTAGTCVTGALSALRLWRYCPGMAQAEQQSRSESGAPSRAGLLLLGGGAFGLLLAGLLLWWREGSRLFADGLIATIVACF